MTSLLKEKRGIGVVIARMQVPYLTESHKATINTVLSRHRRVIIFLGVTGEQIDFRNPFPFEFRKQMLQTAFSDQLRMISIIPLPDNKLDNKAWVNTLDNMIKSLLMKGEDAVLYGGRDSFIPYYKSDNGRYQCIELEPRENDSGTELRELSSIDVPQYSVPVAEAILWAIKQTQT